MKETFRVFSKDEEGCITASEFKFVMNQLPGKVTYKEVDEMINTVDKNKDGKINYSEFRVMMGAHPLLIPGPFQPKVNHKKNGSKKTELTDEARRPSRFYLGDCINYSLYDT